MKHFYFYLFILLLSRVSPRRLRQRSRKLIYSICVICYIRTAQRLCVVGAVMYFFKSSTYSFEYNKAAAAAAKKIL